MLRNILTESTSGGVEDAGGVTAGGVTAGGR
jgi:hypothetical protein